MINMCQYAKVAYVCSIPVQWCQTVWIYSLISIHTSDASGWLLMSIAGNNRKQFQDLSQLNNTSKVNLLLKESCRSNLIVPEAVHKPMGNLWSSEAFTASRCWKNTLWNFNGPTVTPVIILAGISFIEIGFKWTLHSILYCT